MECLITQQTQQAAKPFYVICNLIDGSHDLDLKAVFKITSEMSDKLASMLYSTLDKEYNCQRLVDIERAYEAIVDVFEGERVGMGSCICDTIEAQLKQGRDMIYNDLRNLALYNRKE